MTKLPERNAVAALAAVLVQTAVVLAGPDPLDLACTPVMKADGTAVLAVRGRVTNTNDTPADVSLKTRLVYSPGAGAGDDYRRLGVPAHGQSDFSFEIAVNPLFAWQTGDDCYVYTLDVWADGAGLAGHQCKPVVFRSTEIRPNGEFRLNGRRQDLQAVVFPDVASVDPDLVRDLGANALRLAEGSLPTDVRLTCERMGLLVLDGALAGAPSEDVSLAELLTPDGAATERYRTCRRAWNRFSQTPADWKRVPAPRIVDGRYLPKIADGARNGSAKGLRGEAWPRVGTSLQSGKTFPGACAPFGMVQFSPDTVTGGDTASGYSYPHTWIEGFSAARMSGVGAYGDFGYFQAMPTCGARVFGRRAARSAFTHEREHSEVGYYRVLLERYGITVEATALRRAGALRFTYPASDASRVQIDLGRRIGMMSDRIVFGEQTVKVTGARTFEGFIRCDGRDGGWCHAGDPNYTVWFAGELSKAPRCWGTAEDGRVAENVTAAHGTNLVLFAEFPTHADEAVTLTVAFSFASAAGARKNFEAEDAGAGFDAMRTANGRLWDDVFDRVSVSGGETEARAAFATALYHTAIDPRRTGDADDQASEWRRTVFSGWDVYRSAYPFYSLVMPEVVTDTIRSMVAVVDEGKRKTLPVWDIFGCRSSCMNGNPLIPVMAEAWADGIRDWDLAHAYELAVVTSCRRGTGEQGFVSGDLSSTLEYCHDDWCMARLAEALGKKEDAARYDRRALAYRSCWSREVGWMRARVAGPGERFLPWRGRLDFEHQGCAEANPQQMAFFVPGDIYGLIALMGGDAAFAHELGGMFERVPASFRWNPWYNHSNEPSHTHVWMFPFAGRADLTQKWTRRICRGAYSADVLGIVGDDDCGQMSAWYVLASLGLHPACPGSGVWILTTPMFPEVTLKLSPRNAKGATFSVRAPGAEDPANDYIRAARLNGKPLDRAYLTSDEILAGGVLELELGREPAPATFVRRPPQGVSFGNRQ